MSVPNGSWCTATQNSHLGWGGTHRLGILREELVVRLVGGGKVGHVGQVDVDLEHAVDAAAAGLEHGGQVAQALARAVLDGALDEGLGLGVHADGAAAEEEAVVVDALGELGEGRGRRRGAHRGALVAAVA
ncbi:unnamed protein product [Clonostachys solani]|uniref:Uncharacterized protein n=1 Tax=Clonostachys solani TaxID=160281 RepID=A0A9N9WC15_9HYPO|nr:unnamed protein product [Clonostachys solani]